MELLLRLSSSYIFLPFKYVQITLLESKCDKYNASIWMGLLIKKISDGKITFNGGLGDRRGNGIILLESNNKYFNWFFL